MKANIKDRKLEELIGQARFVADSDLPITKEVIHALCDELEKCKNLRKFLKDANRGAERNYKLAIGCIQRANDIEKKAAEFLAFISPHRFKVLDMHSDWKISDD